MQVNAGVIKGLNVEQCLFIPLVSGQIRLGWKTVMDGIQQDPLWSEGKQDDLKSLESLALSQVHQRQSVPKCQLCPIAACPQPHPWQGRDCRRPL